MQGIVPFLKLWNTEIWMTLLPIKCKIPLQTFKANIWFWFHTLILQTILALWIKFDIINIISVSWWVNTYFVGCVANWEIDYIIPWIKSGIWTKYETKTIKRINIIKILVKLQFRSLILWYITQHTILTDIFRINEWLNLLKINNCN